MFKLIKIAEGGACTPEIMSMPVYNNITYKIGTVAFFESGRLTYTRSNNNSPIFYILENVTEGSGKEYIKVYPITPNMIFEADAIQEREEDLIPSHGLCYMVKTGSYVTYELGDEFICMDNREAANRGKIVGRFKV